MAGIFVSYQIPHTKTPTLPVTGVIFSLPARD